MIAAHEAGVKRLVLQFLCLRLGGGTADRDVAALRESDAYPVMPEDDYG
jgi:hypothetical protein